MMYFGDGRYMRKRYMLKNNIGFTVMFFGVSELIEGECC